MLKTIVLTAPLLAMVTATAAVAKERISDVVVFDHNKTVIQSTPVKSRECYNVEVPIYETVTRNGNAAGGALLGMLIGGAIGKGVTGKDDGAAAGAIMGGLIGADKGSQPKTEQRITGYKQERKCEDVMIYQDTEVEVYSHSTIRFYIDGKRYVVDFVK